MPIPGERDFLGKAQGTVFTTSPLEFSASSRCTGKKVHVKKRNVSIVWEGEKAWRLRLIGHANESIRLPGRNLLLFAERLKAKEEGVTIVVASRKSGLGSLHNWLRCGNHSLHAVSVNLMEAEQAGETTEARLAAITENLRRHIAELIPEDELPSSGDPAGFLRELKGGDRYPEALLLKNFDALDRESAERLFGRLRSLYEDAAQARRLPALVLLGHSVSALDPEEKGPVSSLLSISSLYTVTSLLEGEVGQMAAKVKSVSPMEISEILHWTGGHPHLVQAIFRLIQVEEVETPRESIDFILRERLPAFDIWIQRLKVALKSPEVSRIISTLLSRGRFLRSGYEHRASVLELLVQGWVRLDSEENAWVFHSEFHRRLAAEAYGQRGR